MSSKVLDPKKIPALQPAHALWKLYRPDEACHRFRARSRAEARVWQRQTRRALARLLGVAKAGRAPVKARLIERRNLGDFVREKLLVRTAPDSLTPLYLLLPRRGPRPLPVVLAFHGHGYGVKDIVGLWEDGSERREPDGYQADFAVALCRAGFAVAAPEISCFGERTTDFSRLKSAGAPTTCVHTALLASHLGLSALALRVREAMRVVDLLASRRDLDLSRLGAMGISGGGMHTFFSACLDTRIRACVVSGYFCTFRDSIFAMHHCPCNVVPGLSAFGEMYDLAGLVAPRPMLIEAGSRDTIFPLGAVRRSVSRARAVYGVWGARAALQTDYFEGRHRISGRKAYAFLQDFLKA